MIIIMSWHEETKRLALSSTIPKSKICSDLEIERSWYTKWIGGKIPNPGIERIQKIYDYLKDIDDKSSD